MSTHDSIAALSHIFLRFAAPAISPAAKDSLGTEQIPNHGQSWPAIKKNAKFLLVSKALKHTK